MPQTIEVPGVGAVEFPDGMSDDEIVKAIRRDALVRSNPAEYDPQSPEYQAKYGAVSGERGNLPVRIPGTNIGFDIPVPQGVSNLAAGAGKATADAGRAIKGLALDAFGGGEEYRKETDAVQARDAALMNTTGGLVGNIAGNVALTVLPGGAIATAGKVAKAPSLVNAGRSLVAPNTFRGATALGAGTGLLQPVGTDDSRTANVIAGGLLGAGAQGVVKTVGRVAQPIKDAAAPVYRSAVKTLQAAGVPLDAAQASASQTTAGVKRFLNDNPITAGGQVAQAEKTQAGFNRAALKTIGADADAATPDVLDKALRKIEGTFDDIAKRNSVKIDDRALARLSDLSEEAKQILESPQAAIINRQIDEIIDKAAGTGSIPGRTYQNLRSTIGEISGTGAPGVKKYAGKLRTAIDDALERSVSGADVAALKDARVKFRNYNGIFDAVMADTGTVSAPRLYQALNKSAYGAKKGLKTGRGETDLFKLARAGRAIIPEKLPNSGTAARVGLQTLAGGAIGGLGGALSGQDVLGTAAAGAGIGAGRYYSAKALQKLINSPGGSRYLTQGIQSPLARRALLAPSGQSLPAAALRQLPAAGLLSLYGSQ